MSETQQQIKQPLFALGRLVATPGALELLTRSEQTPLEFLARHSRGDWGECCAEDAIENDFSVKAGVPNLQRQSHTQWRKASGHRGSRPQRNNATSAKRILKLKRARKRANASSPKHRPSTTREKIDAQSRIYHRSFARANVARFP